MTPSEELAREIAGDCPPEVAKRIVKNLIPIIRKAFEKQREEAAKMCDKEASDIKILDSQPMTGGSAIAGRCAHRIRSMEV